MLGYLGIGPAEVVQLGDQAFAAGGVEDFGRLLAEQARPVARPLGDRLCPGIHAAPPSGRAGVMPPMSSSSTRPRSWIRTAVSIGVCQECTNQPCW